MAHEGGASALLVFPSGVYTFGQRPEMALDHFKRIADATDLPPIGFRQNSAIRGNATRASRPGDESQGRAATMG
jgi:dihydrodipicolinate synthase/N-acetylneuraminate lyase